MKNHHSLRALLIWMTALICCNSDATVQAQSSKKASDVVITVLNKKVFRRTIDPATLDQQRKTMSAENFERWQSESRWRPYVSSVSHHLMKDWAKQNNVRPTPEELQELYDKEWKQHLMEYNNVESIKSVAFTAHLAKISATEWAIAKALHEKYGGRVAVSSFGGWISIEGRNALLKEYAAFGKIQFHDPQIEKAFWEGIKSNAVLDTTISDPKRIAKYFASPPWEGWGERTAKRLKENPERSKLLGPLSETEK